MSRYLQKKFALSEQGGRNLTKAVWACTLTNISFMFPMGVLLLLIDQLFSPLTGRQAPAVSIGVFILISLLLLAVIWGLEYIQYNSTFIASYQESADLRIRLAEKLRRLPLSFFGKRDLADLTTVIMADCAWMEKAFSHFIPELLGAVISTSFIGVCLLLIDWRMGLSILWVAPFSFVLAVGSRPAVGRMEKKQKDMKVAASDGIQECIENFQDIRACNQQETYLSGLDQKMINVEKVTIKLELFNGVLVSSAQMILKVGIATTVLAGTWLLTKNQIDIMVFIMFIIAATRIYGPLSGSLINLSAVCSTMIQVGRMREIEEQKVQEGTSQASYENYDIVFDHVGFAYQEEAVIKDLSFTARQGEVTALVGPSGGGKSTAAKLAARFWDISQGKVTLGGVDTRDVDPETLLQSFSIVFQDVVLFNNTVMENIRLGRKDASDQEVMAAARAARCEGFIDRLPCGYDTVIGENGSTLSGGERQRLSIARALLKNAPVILLDEATASLDVENETFVQEAISNLVKGKTVLMIAHRMRTVAGADKIVVLKDGTVAEQGSPKELMEAGGIYRHMVELQNRSRQWTIKG